MSLENGGEQTGHPVAQADGQRAGAQRLRRYLARRITSGIKKGFQPRRQRGVVHLHIELEVQAQAARIPISRTQAAPLAVYQHQLAVVERARPFEDAYTVLQHLPVVGARGPLHRGMVAVCGRQHLDAHAAQRGRAQRRDHRLIGHEVRCWMRTECFAALKAPMRRSSASVQGLIGTGLDAARPRGSLLISRCGRFAPETLAEPLVRGIAPIIGEAPHQMLYHRPAQTKVQIVTGLARRIGPPIRAEDVHAAGETRLAIDHQQLAVIAQMRGMQARGNQCRVERRSRRGRRCGRPAGIHVVDQHLHLHAALMSPPPVTVDAEQPIQQRTAQRQQGDQQYPQRGRSRVTLVDDRVPPLWG